MTTPRLRLLTIAGSDSGGGSGIQADLKTFAAFEGYGLSVITAVKAQNTLGIQGVEGITPPMVSLQLSSVVSDIGVDAIKIGTLFSCEIIKSVSNSFSVLFPAARPPIVLDPVFVSPSGHLLLDPLEAVSCLITLLLPWTTIITPNVPEAIILTEWVGEITTLEDLRACARKVGDLGVKWVLLKGGHVPFIGERGVKVVVDLLWGAEDGVEVIEEHPWVEGRNWHGTGCSLSSAIAASLGKRLSVPEAVKTASDYVSSAIAASYSVGAGSDPIHHFHGLVPRSILLPTKTNPQPFTDLLLAFDADAWQRYVNHPFPNGLGAGTLPLKCFLHFIQQDYHYLKQYARANALAAFKTEDIGEMTASMEITNTVIRETEVHVKYCEKYGISREALLAVPESVTCVAYTRYILDVVSRGDLLNARIVTLPCLLGYGHVGARLVSATEGVDSSDQNPYWGWIKEYGSDWYQGAVKTGIDLLEETVVKSPISKSRLRELLSIFQKTTELEIAFWDAAMAAA